MMKKSNFLVKTAPKDLKSKCSACREFIIKDELYITPNIKRTRIIICLTCIMPIAQQLLSAQQEKRKKQLLSMLDKLMSSTEQKE